jgi:sirohydrochlorin ferrochelatase
VSAALDQLAAAVADESGPERLDVGTAFLDLTDPDLATAAASLRAAGHRRAVVLPLLFTEAFHARVDLPATVAKARQETGLELITADVLGTGGDIETLLDASLADAGIGPESVVMVYAVGSSDAEANAAVMSLASRLGSRRGSWDFAAFATCDPRGDEQLGLVERLTVLPLFVSPGLLLTRLETAAADHGVTVLPPLGTRLAPIIFARYRSAVGSQHP